jgi:hypothetical protein
VLFQRAAEQGDANAQYNLGVMYAKGQGVPEDYVWAYAWINLAKAAGNELAITALPKIKTVMSKEQIMEGQNLSRQIYGYLTGELSITDRGKNDASNDNVQTDVEVNAASEVTKAEAELQEAESRLAETVAKLAPAGDGPDLIESRISGNFEGWDGDTILKLENGQVWQQVTYAYTYHYAYRPEVWIIKTHGAYKMKVDGVAGSIFVKRIK